LSDDVDLTVSFLIQHMPVSLIAVAYLKRKEKALTYMSKTDGTCNDRNTNRNKNRYQTQ